MGENIQDLQKVSNALKITGLTAQLLQLTLFELFLHNVQRVMSSSVSPL